jgi:hypothetical protein
MRYLHQIHYNMVENLMETVSTLEQKEVKFFTTVYLNTDFALTSKLTENSLKTASYKTGSSRLF